MRAGRRPSTVLHSKGLQHTLRTSEHTTSAAVGMQALADHAQDSTCWPEGAENRATAWLADHSWLAPALACPVYGSLLSNNRACAATCLFLSEHSRKFHSSLRSLQCCGLCLEPPTPTPGSH